MSHSPALLLINFFFIELNKFVSNLGHRIRSTSIAEPSAQPFRQWIIFASSGRSNIWLFA